MPGADDLREEAVKRWGREGLVSLAFAATFSRMHPALKYALGHGHSCVRERRRCCATTRNPDKLRQARLIS